MTTRRFNLHTALWLAVLFGLAACESVALIGRPTLTSRSATENEIVGRVSDVDTRSNELRVSAEGGARRTIRFDDRTRVLIDGRDYPVSSLRAGDSVALRVRQNDRGDDFTDLIRVRSGGLSDSDQSRDRRRAAQSLEGRIERVHLDLKYFELRPDAGGLTRVYLPPDPNQLTESRFRNIRVGDYVRVEGEFIDNRRFVLSEFL